MAGELPVVNLYPKEDCVIMTIEPKNPEKDISAAAYLNRLQHRYATEGMQTSVYGVLLINRNNRPHVLLLKTVGNPIRKELPGGRLRPGENEIEGLIRKLRSKLGPKSALLDQEWKIGECVGVWWRLNFDNVLYPHCFPNIGTEPKECKKVYLVHLPKHSHFFVQSNRTLVCMSFSRLFAPNIKNANPTVYYLPDQLSRFKLNLVPRYFYPGLRDDDNHIIVDSDDDV